MMAPAQSAQWKAPRAGDNYGEEGGLAGTLLHGSSQPSRARKDRQSEPSTREIAPRQGRGMAGAGECCGWEGVEEMGLEGGWVSPSPQLTSLQE